MPRQLRARVNTSTVDSLQPGDTLRDTEIMGFGARRRSAAAPTYYLQTRVKGRLRFITIGTHGSPWTPASARKEALRLITKINEGLDPGQAKAAARAAPLFAEAADLYLAEHAPKLKESTRADYKRLIDVCLKPAFARRHLADITTSDVAAFHVGLASRPRTANYALAVLSTIMTWAEGRHLRPVRSNPCPAVKKFREVQRQRYLSEAELQRLGAHLDALEAAGAERPAVIAAIRLLLLTGCRLSEILTLQWQHVDLERGLFLLPDSKTGQKVVYLGGQARALLAALPRQPDNPHVVVGERAGAHLVNLQKAWHRIRAGAGIEDVRIHDLRHSFASIAAANGASLPMIGKLLGHSSSLTTQRYAHLVADPIKELSDTVSNAIVGTMRRKD
ncbi:MAG: tyrosine-type recombinase/integrase [Rhizobiales bacterium]|nr:tyrosine-type recombinase/integrase [Hyphomicrobiales bacterium]